MDFRSTKSISVLGLAGFFLLGALVCADGVQARKYYYNESTIGGPYVTPNYYPQQNYPVQNYYANTLHRGIGFRNTREQYFGPDPNRYYYQQPLANPYYPYGGYAPYSSGGYIPGTQFNYNFGFDSGYYNSRNKANSIIGYNTTRDRVGPYQVRR